ncbi:MAG: V-type ATPase 116kDa subunit family protein [Gammaproteobacteria bacterium]|jgi:V/A-type H+-transporting ATPase subunit I
MSLRPDRARWFELLTPREDLAVALEALARTGSVELETRSETHARLDLADLRERLEVYGSLERRYHDYWPPPDLSTPGTPGRPSNILDAALQTLRRWEVQAAPLIQQLESLGSQRADLALLVSLLERTELDALDLALFATSGPLLQRRVYVLPAGTPLEHLPGTVLVSRLSQAREDFLVTAGPAAAMDALTRELASVRGRALHLPALPAARRAALQQMRAQAAALETRVQEIRARLDDLAEAHGLTSALSRIRRLEWFLTHVTTLPVTENFAWVTGWTRDTGGDRLERALAAAGVNAMIGFPPAPQDVAPPMVMRNPWWAQPFELFARLLGTPSADEADPSRLLAILVPLLFGYMFGDVGHGLVLLVAGLWLRTRWPVARILIPNGLAAILFGFVFGSLFGREDLIPALWLHPIEDPLPVLLVPLGGGIVVLLLGLLLNAVEFWWRGRIGQWLQIEAAVLVLYLSLLAGVLVPQVLYLSALAIAWYLGGHLRQSPHAVPQALLQAAGALLESIFQLIVNTISFVRVGAFALAHGGLSLAFVTLADGMQSAPGAALILLAGNLLVIMLEGLVVTIQTTRLILFEFFIRFLQCTGRMFRPLAAPAPTTK